MRNPIANGDFRWIFVYTVKVRNSYRKTMPFVPLRYRGLSLLIKDERGIYDERISKDL